MIKSANGLRFKYLIKVAEIVLVILHSDAELECLFSIAKKKQQNKQNKLTADLVRNWMELYPVILVLNAICQNHQQSVMGGLQKIIFYMYLKLLLTHTTSNIQINMIIQISFSFYIFDVDICLQFLKTCCFALVRLFTYVCSFYLYIFALR